MNRWILCLDQLERVEAALRQSLLIRGSTGQPALKPLAAYARQLQAELARYEEVLGLTPLARVRLGLTAAAEHMTADRVRAMLEEGSAG